MRLHLAHLLLVAVLVPRLGWADDSADAIVRVSTSSALLEAFGDPRISTVLLHGKIRLKRSEFIQGATFLASGRRLTLQASGLDPAVLDLANIVDAIHVRKGAVLEFNSITLTNSASMPIAAPSEHTQYMVPFLPMWPSVTVEPGATIVKNKTLTYYWSSQPEVGCDSYKEDALSVLQPLGLDAYVQFPSRRQDIVLLSGAHQYKQPITNVLTNETAGYLSMMEIESRSLCIPNPLDGIIQEKNESLLASHDRPVLLLGAALGPEQDIMAGGPVAHHLDNRAIAVLVLSFTLVLASVILAALIIRRKLRRSTKQDDVCGHCSHKDDDMERGDGPRVPRSPFEDMKVYLIPEGASNSDAGTSQDDNQGPQTSCQSTDGGTAALLGGTSGQDRHQRSDSVESISARSSLQMAEQAPSLRRMSADGETHGSYMQRPMGGCPIRHAYSLTSENSTVLPSAPSLDHSALAPAHSLSLAVSITAPVPAHNCLTLPGVHGNDEGAVGKGHAGDNPAGGNRDLMRMLSVRTANHAASLTKGDLMRLARKASLVPNNSLVSMPSAASTLSSQTSSGPADALERSPGRHSRRPSDDGTWESPLRRASSAATSDLVNALDAALRMRHSLASTSEEEGEGGDDAGDKKASSSGHKDKIQCERLQKDGLCTCDSAYVDGMPVNVAAKQATHEQVKQRQQPGQPLSLQAEAAALRKAGLASRRPSHQFPASPRGMLEVIKRKRGGRDFDGLHIGQLIGKGSFGRVYQGTWKGATVAVKVITHDATLSKKVDTLRESLVGISIQHPNVMATYKVLTTIKANSLQLRELPEKRIQAARANGYSVAQLGPGSSQQPEEELLETWMLLEHCDGGPLDRAIAKGRYAHDMASIYLCLMDIAAGMTYLHSLGIVHSDLKGANVLLKSVKATPEDSRGYVCKLADFGLSRVLGTNRTHVSTNTYGTVSYQPQEVLLDGRITRASDVYSFAMIMLEMYTGEPVFEGYSSSQILYQVFNGARPHMPDNLPPAYKRIITDCWQKEPSARPTFTAIHSRLRDLYNATAAVRKPDMPEGTLARPQAEQHSAHSTAQRSPAMRCPAAELQ